MPRQITIPVGDKLLQQAARYKELLEKPLSATSARDFEELTTLFKSMAMRVLYITLAELDDHLTQAPPGAH